MDSEREPEKMLCNNCLQNISASIFALHEARCVKHTILCKVCEQAIPRSEAEKHYEEEHAPVACKYCHEKFSKEEIVSHEKNTCPEFMIECKFCELEIPRKDYTEHVAGCGGRTDLCELCNQRVRLRDMYEHQHNSCKLEKDIDVGRPFHGLEAYNQSPLFSSGDMPHHNILFGISSFSSGFVHPFVPLPAVIAHHASQPPPPGEVPRGDNMHVDTQWLASVAGVCGEENVDQVVAQNMMMVEAAGRAPPPPPQSLHYQPTLTPAVLARDNVQRHQHLPAESDNHQDQADHFKEPHNTAGAKVGNNWNMGGEASSISADAELARQLQEEDLTYAQGRGDVTVHQVQQVGINADCEDDARLARQLRERDEAYAEQQRRDQEFAEQLQREEGHAAGRERGGIFDRGVHDQSTYGTQDYGQQPVFDGVKAVPYYPTDDRAGGLKRESRYEDSSYDDQQPRPKTPPLEMGPAQGDVPCEYCDELYPFEGISHHQQFCRMKTYGNSRNGSYFPTTSKREEGMYPMAERKDVELARETFPNHPFPSSSFPSSSRDELLPYFPSARDEDKTYLSARDEDKTYLSASDKNKPYLSARDEVKPYRDAYGDEDETYLSARDEVKPYRDAYGDEDKLHQLASHASSHLEMKSSHTSHRVEMPRDTLPPREDETHLREDALALTGDTLRELSSRGTQRPPPFSHMETRLAKVPGPESRDREETRRPKLAGPESRGEACGPCEVCGKLISIKSLVRHESTCQFQQKRKDNIALKAAPPKQSHHHKASSGSMVRNVPSSGEHVGEPNHHSIGGAHRNSAQSSSSSSSKSISGHLVHGRSGFTESVVTSRGRSSAKAAAKLSPPAAEEAGKWMVHGAGVKMTTRPNGVHGNRKERAGGGDEYRRTSEH